jgi:hypothetical protein
MAHGPGFTLVSFLPPAKKDTAPIPCAFPDKASYPQTDRISSYQFIVIFFCEKTLTIIWTADMMSYQDVVH